MASDGTSNGVSSRNYIRWDTSGVEKVPPNEAEDIQAVVEMINHIQRLQFNKSRHAFGGTHARTQGLVKGKFKVEDNLPPHLKQTELFSKGGEYDTVCRYSSEPGDPGLDVCEQFQQCHVSTNVIQGPHSSTPRLCNETLRRHR